MKKMFTKKRIVLLGLFILPLVFFLFLSTGINNFNKLPVLTKNITFSDSLLNKTLEEKVSVIFFPGNDIEVSKNGLFNLNEKIYKKFYDYRFFQAIVIFPSSKKVEVKKLKEQLGAFTDMQKWHFYAMSDEEIINIHQKLRTTDNLNENLYSSKAFLLDKQSNLRGRNNDEDIASGFLYGYNTNSVAELRNKMIDDIQVLLYEYRAAFKNKNKAKRENN